MTDMKMTYAVVFGLTALGLYIWRLRGAFKAVRYNERLYAQRLEAAIREGSALPSRNRTEVIIATILTRDLVICLVCGAAWPAALLWFTYVGARKAYEWYNRSDAVVLRYLKKHPEQAQAILDNEGHSYYSVASRLRAAGTVDIDGRLYNIKKR